MADDDDGDNTYPTPEEMAQYKKDLFGDNVVQFPTGQKDDTPQDRALALSKDYAIVTKNARVKVIDETRPDDIIFLDKKDFYDKLSYRKVTITVTQPKGGISARFEPEAKLWFENPKARRYERVIFNPHPSKKHSPNGGGDYNLWPNFVVKPKHGVCIKTLRYFRKILSNGNKTVHRWRMAWAAQMFQRPWEKPETAICLHGEEEGTGKSFFPLILSKLMDGYDSSRAHRLYFKTSNAKMITGDFSGHLEHCLLLHAEEAFRAESEREDSIIKAIISEEDQGINPKGVEAKITKNYIRLILTGNPPHIVKAGRFARRFLISNVSSEHRMDFQYFREILDELNNGGYEALMYYFMHYPIDKFNLREAPKTEELLEQKLESLNAEERFWYNMLCIGELPFVGTSENKYYGNGIEYHVMKHKMFNQFQKFTNRRVGRNRSDETSFGMRFAQFFPVINGDGTIRRERNGKNMRFLKTDKHHDTNCYIIPSISLCKAMFSAYEGQYIDWPNSEEWIEKQFGD
jgi:hypothetical protein